MLRKIWNNKNSCSLLVGMQNGTATLEDTLAVSYKAKYNITIQFHQSNSGIYPKELIMYIPSDGLPWLLRQ